MTGNLLLTFTDFVLPGNAGFELRVQRTYNSKIYDQYTSLGYVRTHPEYYRYDVYSDGDGRVRYAFFRSESYGYVMEFKYRPPVTLERVILHPILAGSVDARATVVVNEYFYRDGRLRVVRDDLNGEIILVEEGSAVVYEGILTSAQPFAERRIDPVDYFPELLH